MKATKEIPVDRRIQKTKKALTEALIQLILAKGYEKVTIQDIIDKANVGRSTFYIHYESKAQLLLDGHNNLNVSMFTIEAGKQLNFENLFEHIAQNQQLAKAMLGEKSGQMMTIFFKNNIALKIKKFYSSQFGKTKQEQKMLTYFVDAAAAAVMSLLVSWVEDEMPFTISAMAVSCGDLVAAVFNKPVSMKQ
jgi:AcrR family transcriptional regulator